MGDTQQNGWRGRVALFLVSQSVTLFGSTLVQMAVVWYVTLGTSSGAWVAAFTICAYLPQFLISFIGGVLADRFSRKLLIIASDAVIAAVTLAMALLMPQISDEAVLLTSLLVMSVIRSLGAGIQTPAVNAVIPQLVPEDKLMRYNGINATMQSVVQFAAPAAAGAILMFSALRFTLLIDVATAAIGIGLLAGVLIPKQSPVNPESVLKEMKRGFSYSFSNGTIRRLLITYGLFIFLCVPAGFLATLFVSRFYGDTYWYLTAVELVGFAGMAGGGLLISIKGAFRDNHALLTLSIVAFGALAIGMGLSRNFILYLALMLFYGIALTAVQTATTTLIQQTAEPSMQGRVFGLLGSMYCGFLPIGMAVFGPLADAVHLRLIMLGSGVLLIAIAIFYRSGSKKV